MIDQPAIPAASVILMRPAPGGGADELLIVVRGKALAFAAGAYAFPGGRVDAADRELAAQFPDLDPDDAAARVATLRELREEADIDLGDRGLTAADLAALVPFAHWCPAADLERSRRFDTRFYLAQAPLDTRVAPDGGEIVRAFWATAQDILERCAAGDGRALFPTRRLLQRLAALGDFASARNQALALPQRMIEPFVEVRGTRSWLCIPEDAGYPVTAEPVDTAGRS